MGNFDSADFDGATYNRELDGTRLITQHNVVFELMKNSDWLTLSDINHTTGYPEASISATIRDFRKPKFGKHIVEKRRKGEPSAGIWEYKLYVNIENYYIHRFDILLRVSNPNEISVANFIERKFKEWLSVMSSKTNKTEELLQIKVKERDL